jgi:nitroreductase
MNLIEALHWRYAVRKFSSQRIDERKVRELLNATRLSATSYGLQPYRLILVEDIEVRRKLLPYAMGQDKVADCSHLVVFAAQTRIDECMVDRYIRAVADTRNLPVDDLRGLADHMKATVTAVDAAQRREWAHQQAYIALGTLLTSAALMKIDTCPMTGFGPEGFDRVLGLTAPSR